MRLPGVLRVVTAVGAPLLFMGSCIGMIPLAMRVADPMTHRPLKGAAQSPFPVLVVAEKTAHVEMLATPNDPPAAPAGSTYLVPPGRRREIELYLQAHDTHHDRDGGWTLRIEERGPSLQRVELVWLADGFWGSVYDAEPTRITPRYRKLTGPGFAFVFGPLAVAFNVVLWAAGWLTWRRFGRKDGNR